MKKTQVIFAVAAILFAVAGVFASKFPTVTYYRAANANPGDLGLITADCTGPQVTNPCDEDTEQRCTMLEFTQLEDEDQPTQKIYSISKIVDANPCVAVNKP